MWFVPTTARWATVEYNVKTNGCAKTSERTLEAGVTVPAASFTLLTPQTGNCRTDVGDTNAQIVFFNPSGTATQGTVTIDSSRTGDDPKTLSVSALTGRVTE